MLGLRGLSRGEHTKEKTVRDNRQNYITTACRILRITAPLKDTRTSSFAVLCIKRNVLTWLVPQERTLARLAHQLQRESLRNACLAIKGVKNPEQMSRVYKTNQLQKSSRWSAKKLVNPFLKLSRESTSATLMEGEVQTFTTVWKESMPAIITTNIIAASRTTRNELLPPASHRHHVATLTHEGCRNKTSLSMSASPALG